MRDVSRESDVYSDDDLAVVVWLNHRRGGRGQARALETLTSEKSSRPMAFPTRSLMENRAFSSSHIALSYDEVFYFIPKSSRTNPLIIPVSTAREALGWGSFEVLSTYEESNA